MQPPQLDDKQHDWCMLDACIEKMLELMSEQSLTSVELVARYLRRISVYDASGLKLSAVPIINPHALKEAMASDSRRASGLPPRALEGIPFLVKDNMKVQGMTVAAGSPAFENLIATEDAACVKTLKSAGAIVLGRTNMPAMANGGMQRGVYGRAESPYNSDFLTAGYASGSSNGSATALSANFAAFSLGTETISSGRSPASNNALVAYTPSRGLLPMSGVWPLYPTCDVLVPYTRTMQDMLLILDIFAGGKDDMNGDFWRDQPFIPLPTITQLDSRPFQALQNKDGLQGKRLGVPSMYIGGASPVPISTRPSVLKLWERAKKNLESCGAVVVEVDFPLVTEYENCDASLDQWANVDNLSDEWLHTERDDLIAHAWDDFLVTNGQTNCDSLSSVDPSLIFPLAPGSLPGESEADNQLNWDDLAEYPKNKPASMFQLPGMEDGLKSLESARKRTMENWMEKLGLDAVVFPANGDVGPSNADIDSEASRLAWLNGVLYSNGNLAIRHLGVPTVSVPMGIMEDIKMPVNITFAGKAYDDVSILQLAYAFEAATHHRQMPPLTPALDSDLISFNAPITESGTLQKSMKTAGPQINVISKDKQVWNESTVHITIQGELTDSTEVLSSANFTCYIDGEAHPVEVNKETWRIHLARPISDRDAAWSQWQSPALFQTIVVLIYRSPVGISAGELVIL